MPCVNMKVNLSLKAAEIKSLQNKISAILVKTLGKPERTIMVIVEGDCNIQFAGSDDPAVFMELKSIGLSENHASALSGELCSLINNELSLDMERIYIEFVNAPGAFWGWNSQTFSGI
jgi:phenylpyruvate tautomerase